jgi:predicted ATPase
MLIVISGCSGGGKSTLIEALRQFGEAVIEEPGRRVIAAEQVKGGNALPWTDMVGFLRSAVVLSRADLDSVRNRTDRIFLDRGLVDAAVALEHLTGEPAEETIGPARFHPTVFFAPPWPEIHTPDPERRHSLAEAMEEYDRLSASYPRLGYQIRLLPKASVTDRIAFLHATLKSA